MFRFRSNQVPPTGSFGFACDRLGRREELGCPLSLRLSEAHGRRNRHLGKSIAALCLTAFVTVFVSNSAVMDKVIARLQLGQATANAMAFSLGRDEPLTFFRPLFGPDAVDSCSRQCEQIDGSGAAACSRACEKLTLSEYARRITFPEVDPKLDATRIVASCNREPFMNGSTSSREDWEKLVAEASKQSEQNAQSPSSKEIAGARLRYERAAKFALDLKPPVNASMRERGLTLSIRRVACLRASYSLTEVGRLLAEQDKDGVSMRYYQTVAQILRNPTVSAERGLSGQISALMIR